MITIEETKININLKFESGLRALNELKQPVLSSEQAFDTFSSFLSSYYSMWSYLKKWVKLTYPSRINPIKYLEKWQECYLNSKEKEIMNLISDFRNIDAHDEPIIPKFKITAKVLGFGNTVLGFGDNILGFNQKSLYVKFENTEHQMADLIQALETSLLKFTDTFEKVKIDN